MLSDETLAHLIGGTKPLVTGIDSSNYTAKDSAIQPGSVDLSVGNIFRPGRRNWFRKGPSSVEEIILKQGETAVIRSSEELNLPDNIAAVAFPPARVSTKGLLMTNVGHVDPGYQGYLHLTVINMGRKQYTIRKDDRLVSLIFFELNKKASKGWIARRGGQKPADSTLVQTALEKLSRDFLDVQQRAKFEARKAVTMMTLWQFVIPVVASIVTSALAVYLYSRQNEAAIARLEGRMAGLGANVNLDSVEHRLDTIEKKMKK